MASGVKVHKASKKIAERAICCFEIEFEGDPLDVNTTGDLYLTRKRDTPYRAAVVYAIYQFERFNSAKGEFISSKEYAVFDGRILYPSVSIFPRCQGKATLTSTVLLEVEFEPRSLQQMNTYCLYYFCKPCVQAVILLKYFPKHAADSRLLAVSLRQLPSSTAAGPVARRRSPTP